MKRLNLYVVGLLIAAMMSAGCNKDDDKKSGAAAGVYVAGYDANSISNQFPALWKDGVAQELELGEGTNGGIANSVYVSGKDVYVAGREWYGERGVAILWKNGVAEKLSDGTRDEYAMSVYVSGNDVYVAGYGNMGILWKNGEAQNLSNVEYVYSVYVSGKDVYVAGSYRGRAILWKNGEVQNLTETVQNGGARANSIYVSGADVYVAGYAYTVDRNNRTISSLRLWKNGESQDLKFPTGVGGTQTVDNQSMANSVYVSGRDVYVAGYAGYSNNPTPILWKNGEPQKLTEGITGNNNDGYGRANSVYVSGSDVYVAGLERKAQQEGNAAATLWKNGEAQALSGRGTEALSVFVVK